MRWPDLFFKAKKRPAAPIPTVAPPFKSSILPEKPATVQAIKPGTPPTEPDESSAIPALQPVREAPLPPTPETLVAETSSSVESLNEEAPVTATQETPPLAHTPPEEPAIVPSSEESQPEAPAAPEPLQAAPAPLISVNMSTLRRKAKLTEVARIVTPSAAQPVAKPEPVEPSAAVTPPAFTVSVPTGSVTRQAEPPQPPAVRPIIPPIVAQIPLQVPPQLKPMPETPEAAPKTESQPSPGLPAVLPEKKEFLLANGERIVGQILSENEQALFLSHPTLGVLTLPKAQIAQRPIEIILINGDRIVGDILAETPETLYVRHSSLGTLTIPRSQRSARVVEALLHSGDRIVGEVLAETDKMTVIRSATLGTVSVPHEQISMLNRKLEQMQLKNLPVALPDKAS